jgi:PAS domain S-box-containing protein
MMGVVEVPADNSDIVHIHCNPATDRFLGRPQGSTVGQTALGMGMTKEAVQHWIEQYRLAERQGKPVQFEYWHRRESGGVWLSAVLTRIGPRGSGRTRFSYVVADMTERKRSQTRVEADLAALTRMHELSRKVLGVRGLEELLQEVVDAAVDIVGANQGTLQLLEGESLRIVAQHGHRAPFLKFFESAGEVASACGEGMRRGERVVVEDVEESVLFAGKESLAVLRAAGVRAVQSTPLMSRSGKILGMVSTHWGRPYRPDQHDLWRIDLLARQAADLIEQSRAEEALRASERLHRAIGESIQYGIWISDPQGRNTYASESFLKLIGLTQEQCSEFGWGDMLHPEEAEATVAAWKECVREGEPWYREHRYRGVNGQWHPVLSCGVPVRDEQGQITCWAGINLDVSRLKAVEEALRASETRLTQAIRVASLGTFEHNHLTDVIEYSPLMRQMMDFGEQEELTIEAIGQKIAAEDREAVVAAIHKAHDPAGDGSYAVEFRVRSADGRVRWVSKRSQTFFEGAGSERRPVRTIGSGLDVTARKEAEADLEKLVTERTAKLQELIEDLEHFSYTITHDMRAPLRAMRGFAELASRTFGKSEEEARELLGKISASAERMDALIRDALNYSQSVRQVLPLEDIDTGALVRGMLDSYPELQPSRAHIRVEGNLPVVLGNEAGLTQCFSNLLGNAVKFVKSGQMPDVRIWGEEREGWARIWVADKGIGISRDMLPRVFDMYSRGSNNYEGTGVGLALVRKVAQRMGGRVGVESDEGTGSRFWIELKNREGSASPTLAGAASLESTVETILYVEDEEADALFMSTAFSDKGLASAFRLVSDGRAAIEYLSGAGKYADRNEYPLPAVVLLDLNLPQVPGFDVLKWMRNHPDFSATPVVVFSSSEREEDKVKATELGANDFVAKPSSGMRFGEVVEQLRQKWLAAAYGSGFGPA